jgi:hypothetical protein
LRALKVWGRAEVGPSSFMGEMKIKLTEVFFQRIFCPDAATAN